MKCFSKELYLITKIKFKKWKLMIHIKYLMKIQYIMEYYKIEKEKGIDKLLLIHDKEEVGFIEINLKNIKL